MTGFVGVHLGAGQHSSILEKKYQQLCKQASKHGVDVLAKGGSAVDAVVGATVILEDSPLTNAGFGSNLSWDGKVECDASLMDGAHLTFGACGAVSGVKNPILLARHICDQQQIPLSLGLIPPCLLTGEGAHRYAIEHNIVTMDPDSLISDKARRAYKHCKKKLYKYQEHLEMKKNCDTVLSSEAAMQGAGCWADNSVGVVSTGCGEHLMATSLAREAARNIHASLCPTSALRGTFLDGFLGSPLLKNVEEKLAGLLVITVKDGRGEMLYAHTTDSMCIGYMTTDNTKAKSRMSRLPAGSKHGYSLTLEGVSF